MVTLFDGGAYLINGTELIQDGQAVAGYEASTGNKLSKEEAAKNTMAYQILQAHNTSGNDKKLQIKFDKLTSHDITFVGIIQTARASGLEKFPIPYVRLMRMTICLDCPVQSVMAECMYHLIRQLSISLPEKCWQPADR